MRFLTLFILTLASTGLLAACVDPGARHKANTFNAGQVNQRQEVKTVTILLIKPAKVEVSNARNQEIAQSVGTVLGAILGAGLGDDHNRGSQGAVIGGVTGAEAGRLGQGSTKLVDGVQLVYQEGNRVLQSAQVGLPCEYAPGPALVTVTQAEETRIQPNHTCVEGQEMTAGTVSNLQGLGAIAASDQKGVDDLERQRALIRKRQEVQSAKTGLARESARTDSATTKVDLELDTHRSVNTAIKEGAKNPPTIVIK